MDPLPATLGEFRITAVLGQGGSGVVYDATWGPRRVALKVVHPSLVGTGKERAQYVAEAQRLQQLAHPSVVKVFAVGELPDGRPFLAMERLEGETLARVLERGPLPMPLALTLFTDLCGAVSALHEQGLVHRDLKPENVFVVSGQHAVLLDFGIAKELASPPSTTTQEGHVRGTPAYMAPERFFGQPAGVATDIYELALVLYTTLAGRLPWAQLADPEARLAPEPLTAHARVPEALDVEVRRALSTRAQNRPPSARALLAAVLAAASGSAAAAEPMVTGQLRPAAEPPRPASERAPTPEQQTPLAWAPTLAAARRARSSRRGWLVAGLSVALLGGGGLAWLELRPGDTPAAKPQAEHEPPKIIAPPPLANDPWGEKKTATSAIPLVEPRLSVETYRAEIAAAIARLPADTHFVLTAEIGELHAQPQLDNLLDRIAKKPQVKMLAGTLPQCVRELVADAEWIAYGAPSMHEEWRGTLVLRGRWLRKDVDACFGATGKPVELGDHATLYRVGDSGWLDFIDDHTVYVTLRSDLGAEAIHAAVRHGAGPPQHARDLLARLPADRSISLVLDGHTQDDLSDVLSLPKGSDLLGWLRAEPAGVTLDLAADPHDVLAAKLAVAKLRPQLTSAFGDTPPNAVGKLDITSNGTVIHLRGNLSALMITVVSSML
jgi:serine/threonine-protein kinase